jgi:superfamily II DNA or RNA helicase
MMSNDFLSRIRNCDPTYYMAKKNYIPYVHQQLLLWKWRLRKEVKVLVGDEIGLGKTIEAALLLKALIVDRSVKRILVLVPKILRDQWYRELSNFFGSYHVKVIDSEDDMRQLSLESKDFMIFIISIDLAKREVYRRYFENRWDVLVVDEAHYLGGDSLRDYFVRSLNAEHRIYLSATPHRGKADKYLRLVGHLGNVRSIQDTKKFVERRTKRLVNKLRKELHGGGNVKPVFSNCRVVAIVARATDEEKQFSEEITSFLEYIIRSRNMNEPVLLLTTLIRKRVSSSPRAAVETLKRMLGKRFSGAEKIDQKLLKSLASGAVEDLSEALEGFKASEVDEIYEKVTEAFAAGLNDGKLVRLGGLLDLAESIKEDDSKLKILKVILRLHTSRGEKVIVFTEYKDTLDYLSENLGEFNPVTIYGGLDEMEIKGRVEEFRDRGTVLLATDVASEGLNLQIANIVVNYEPPWTPVKLEQRMGRVWRLGQDKDVTVYNLFLGTRADIDVVEKLYKKVLNVAEALEDVKNVLGESVESVEMFLSRTIEEELPLIDVTENKLISAQLRGTFDKEVGEIEERIREVRANLSSAYPVENEKNLKSLIDRLGLPSELNIAEVLRGRFEQALGRIEGKVALIFSNEPGYCYGGIARVDLGGFSVEFPLYIEEVYEGDVLKVRSGKIGLGAFLELCRVAERAIIPDEAYVSKGSEILEARRLEPSSTGVRGLVRDLLKSINPEAGIMSVTFEKFFTIVKLPQEALATSRRYSKETGQMGEDLVKRLEEFRGASVVERKTLGSYDFYTYDPSESNQPEGKRESERYIEVKTHGRGGEWLRLEEGEAEFARNCGQKYWLYTVWMLYGPGDSLILCFRNPLNNPSFRAIEGEEEIIVRKRALLLRFNVPGS